MGARLCTRQLGPPTRRPGLTTRCARFASRRAGRALRTSGGVCSLHAVTDHRDRAERDQEAILAVREVLNWCQPHIDQARTERGLFQVMPNSQFAADDEDCAPARPSPHVRSALLSAYDNLDLLREIFCSRDEVNVYISAHYSLIRTVIEASADAIWLSAESGVENRRLRALGFALRDMSSLRSALNGVPFAPNDELRAKIALAETLSDEILRVGERLGFDGRALKAAARTSISEIVRASGMDHNSGLLHWSAWAACSGFTHSRPWVHLIHGHLDYEDDGGPVIHGMASADLGATRWMVEVAVIAVRRAHMECLRAAGAIIPASLALSPRRSGEVAARAGDAR